MEANTISSKVEEKNYVTYHDGGMTKLNEEEKKHNAKDTMLRRCHDKWERGRHKITDTKDKNGL